MHLYALVAADSNFAIDLFTSRASAQQALCDVLHDEPAFEPLLEIVPIPPPWHDARDRDFAAEP